MIARASTESEEEEEKSIHNIEFIKGIIGDETYTHLLNAENSEGLRPLELAAHLGTFLIFKHVFETPNVYMTDSDHKLYRIQYFDITEYILGNRCDRSPVKAMLHLEEKKLSLRSTQMLLQDDPMKSWFRAILYANIPFLILWFFVRLFLFGSMILVDLQSFPTYVCPYGSFNMSRACAYTTGFNEYLPGYWHPLGKTVIVVVLLSLLDDIINLILFIFRRPRWLGRTVYGKKVTCVRYNFYRIIHICCLCGYLLQVLLKEFTNRYIGIMNFVVACGFVWSFLFFLQIIPVLGNYVIATQRMVRVFVEFSLLCTLFFVPYAFAFYMLLSYSYGAYFASIRLALYNTFLVMQNIFSFNDNPRRASEFGLQLLHVTFITVVPILLLKFLTAVLISAYAYVNDNRRVLMTIQRLSVAMAADDRFNNKFTKCLTPLRNHLRNKYLVYEGGRVYVTRTVLPQKN